MFLMIRSLGLVVTLSLLVSACAPTPFPEVFNDGFKDADEASFSSTASLDNLDCPQTANVRYQSSYDLSGLKDFKVCSDPASPSHFVVIPNSTKGGTMFCAFPMNATTQSLALSAFAQCFEIKNGKADLQFSSQNNSTSMNYMIITEYQYAGAMTQCLSGASACPPRAEGFIQ